jgi:hypothetical protein
METHTIPSQKPTCKLRQKIATIPYTPTTQGTKQTKYNLNIHIVANSNALTLLEPHTIQSKLHKILTHVYGQSTRTTKVDTGKLYANQIDSRTSYTDIPAPISSHQIATILNTEVSVLENMAFTIPFSTTRNGLLGFGLLGNGGSMAFLALGLVGHRDRK